MAHLIKTGPQEMIEKLIKLALMIDYGQLSQNRISAALQRRIRIQNDTENTAIRKRHNLIAKLSKIIGNTSSSEHQEQISFMDNKEEFRLNPVRFLQTERSRENFSQSLSNSPALFNLYRREHSR